MFVFLLASEVLPQMALHYMESWARFNYFAIILHNTNTNVEVLQIEMQVRRSYTVPDANLMTRLMYIILNPGTHLEILLKLW